MSLACGGRGPCCHIGYAHRHCEHCDFVIPLQHSHFGYFQQPYYAHLYSGINSGGLLYQLQAGHAHEEATNGGQLSQAS